MTTIKEMDEKTRKWAEQLKVGFKPFLMKHMPQILDAYTKECDECAMCLPEEERLPFIMAVHEDMKRVMGIE
jgi:hypothetical protein